MYTQCPDCQVAFRITAEVLQQARGQVRCGACGIAFNALDHLHEEPPKTAAAPRSANGDDPDERSKALLDTLDRLAGPDQVRIEDTGVEWLVLDDEGADGDDGSAGWHKDSPESAAGAKRAATDVDLETAETTEQPVLDARTLFRLESEEPRYDDNTPLPDDFLDGDDDYLPPPVEVPRRRASDFVELHRHDDNQAELELSEPGDWTELLDEVADEAGGGAREAQPLDDDAKGELPLEVEEELAAIHDELSSLPDSSDGPSVDEALPASEDAPPAEAAANQGGKIEAVAEELDELLESIEAPAEDADAQASASADDDEAGVETEDATAGGDQSIDDAAESMRDGERADTAGSEPIETADEGEPVGDEAAADDEQIAAALDEALADDGTDVLTGEIEAPDATIAYEESTGEFERAIAEAEDAIKHETAEANGEADGDAAEQAGADAEDDDGVADLAAMTGNMQIDEKLLRAMKDEELAAAMTNEDGSPVVETIVMEGDVVHGALARDTDTGEVELPPIADPGSLVDTYMMTRTEKARTLLAGGKRWIAGIVLLGLLLAGQYVHTARETLATNDTFNRTIGSIYRMFGNPVTPKWDIKGWQFEATSGSTGEDDELLTIYSRIANRSSQALPYPLVHVSLTDRYEEIIGSRVLEPNEYLAGDADPSSPVAAGGDFTAVITIASPSPDATGFKLNVCYRVSSGRVRCAIEDFKTP